MKEFKLGPLQEKWLEDVENGLAGISQYRQLELGGRDGELLINKMFLAMNWSEIAAEIRKNPTNFFKESK